MKAATLKYIISLFFVSLLLFKAATSIISVFSSRLDKPVTEFLMETEDKKNSSRAETSLEEELFGKALLPEEFVFITNNTSTEIDALTETLPGVYLDTLTPPPNSLSC